MSKAIRQSSTDPDPPAYESLKLLNLSDSSSSIIGRESEFEAEDTYVNIPYLSEQMQLKIHVQKLGRLKIANSDFPSLPHCYHMDLLEKSCCSII